MKAGDTLPMTRIPLGSGMRMSIDRDRDGVLDDEQTRGNSTECDNNTFCNRTATRDIRTATRDIDFCQPGIEPGLGHVCGESSGVCMPFACDENGACERCEDCEDGSGGWFTTSATAVRG